MAYFKIGNNDYSTYVNSLKVNKTNLYNSQVNAAGDSVVDLITVKRTIEVGIIPLDDTVMAQLVADLEAFEVSISYRDPKTNLLTTGVHCIIPKHDIEYYTIQADKVMYKTFNLTFTEL